MSHNQALSLSPQAIRSFPFVQLRQTLPSQIALISPFADQLMRFIATCRNQDDSGLEIEMALREALANACADPNASRHEELMMTMLFPRSATVLTINGLLLCLQADSGSIAATAEGTMTDEPSREAVPTAVRRRMSRQEQQHQDTEQKVRHHDCMA